MKKNKLILSCIVLLTCLFNTSSCSLSFLNPNNNQGDNTSINKNVEGTTGEKYKDIQDAINAGEKEITLNGSVTLEDDLHIKSDKELTINLNNKDITTCTYSIIVDGSLTLFNGLIKGSIIVSGDYLNNYNSTLTLEKHVTFREYESNGKPGIILNSINSTLNIKNDADIQLDDYEQGIIVNAGKLNIAGKMNSTCLNAIKINPTLENADNTIVTIEEGAKINSERGIVELNSGNLFINGEIYCYFLEPILINPIESKGYDEKTYVKIGKNASITSTHYNAIRMTGGTCDLEGKIIYEGDDDIFPAVYIGGGTFNLEGEIKTATNGIEVASYDNIFESNINIFKDAIINAKQKCIKIGKGNLSIAGGNLTSINDSCITVTGGKILISDGNIKSLHDGAGIDIYADIDTDLKIIGNVRISSNNRPTLDIWASQNSNVSVNVDGGIFSSNNGNRIFNIDEKENIQVAINENNIRYGIVTDVINSNYGNISYKVGYEDPTIDYGKKNDRVTFYFNLEKDCYIKTIWINGKESTNTFYRLNDSYYTYATITEEGLSFTVQFSSTKNSETKSSIYDEDNRLYFDTLDEAAAYGCKNIQIIKNTILHNDLEINSKFKEDELNIFIKDSSTITIDDNSRIYVSDNKRLYIYGEGVINGGYFDEDGSLFNICITNPNENQNNVTTFVIDGDISVECNERHNAINGIKVYTNEETVNNFVVSIECSITTRSGSGVYIDDSIKTRILYVDDPDHNDGFLYIQNAKIHSSFAPAIYMGGYCLLNICDGEYESAMSALEVSSGYVRIRNGEFNSIASIFNPIKDESHPYVEGAGLAIKQNNLNRKIIIDIDRVEHEIINHPHFSGQKGIYSEYVKEADQVTFNIKDAKIAGKIAAMDISEKHTSNLTTEAIVIYENTNTIKDWTYISSYAGLKEALESEIIETIYIGPNRISGNKEKLIAKGRIKTIVGCGGRNYENGEDVNMNYAYAIELKNNLKVECEEFNLIYTCINMHQTNKNLFENAGIELSGNTKKCYIYGSIIETNYQEKSYEKIGVLVDKSESLEFLDLVITKSTIDTYDPDYEQASSGYPIYLLRKTNLIISYSTILGKTLTYLAKESQGSEIEFYQNAVTIENVKPDYSDLGLINFEYVLYSKSEDENTKFLIINGTLQIINRTQANIYLLLINTNEDEDYSSNIGLRITLKNFEYNGLESNKPISNAVITRN